VNDFHNFPHSPPFSLSLSHSFTHLLAIFDDSSSTEHHTKESTTNIHFTFNAIQSAKQSVKGKKRDKEAATAEVFIGEITYFVFCLWHLR